MMGRAVDHIVSELKDDLNKENNERNHIEKKRENNQAKFEKLLAEIVETERIYVQDLEEVFKQAFVLFYLQKCWQVCADYAQLAEVSDKRKFLSLDRKKEDKKLSRHFSIQNSESSQDCFKKSTGTVSTKE